MEKTKTKEKDITINKPSVTLAQITKPILFFVAALLFEMLEFICINFKSNGHTVLLPKYIGFDLGVILLISALIYISKKRWLQDIIMYIFVLLQIVICYANCILMGIHEHVFYTEQLYLITEGTTSFNLSIISGRAWVFMALILYVFLSLMLTQIMIDIFGNQQVEIKRWKFSQVWFNIMVFSIMMAVGVSSYGISIGAMSSTDKEFYYQELVFPNPALQKFGIYGYYPKGVLNMLVTPKIGYTESEIRQMIKESEVPENPDAPLHGDNLIFLLMESLDWFGIDPYNTPNLYRLQNESVTATQFISNNATNISEIGYIQGYFPFTDLLNKLTDNSLCANYAIPNLFKQMGYKTSYFHPNFSWFYDRGNINPKLGFDNLTFLSDVELENKQTKFNHWNRELDFYNAIKDQIISTDEPFMSMYLTISAHGTYDIEKPNFADCIARYDANFEQAKEYLTSKGFTYPTSAQDLRYLRNFKSSVIDYDDMVGQMLEDLNNTLDSTGTPLIENTTIVLVADHNAYYHDLAYTMRNNSALNTSDQTLYDVPLMIYSKKLSPQKVTTLTTSNDVYPTICQLFGLGYNTFMSFGDNILTENVEADKCYLSRKTGWYGYNTYSRDIFNVTTSKDVSNDQIDKFIELEKEQYRRLSILNNIYRRKTQTK